MSRLDLFGPVETKPRRVLMKAVDTGEAPGKMPGWKSSMGADFICPKCGHRPGWVFNLSMTEIRNGLPCPVCVKTS